MSTAMEIRDNLIWSIPSADGAKKKSLWLLLMAIKIASGLKGLVEQTAGMTLSHRTIRFSEKDLYDGIMALSDEKLLKHEKLIESVLNNCNDLDAVSQIIINESQEVRKCVEDIEAKRREHEELTKQYMAKMQAEQIMLSQGLSPAQTQTSGLSCVSGSCPSHDHDNGDGNDDDNDDDPGNTGPSNFRVPKI